MNTPASRWERRTLGSITSPRKSKGIPNEHGHLPFIGMEHVESHTGRILKYGDSAAYVSAAPLVEPGDVLYGRLRPYLNKVALASERSFVSGEFIPLPGTPAVDSKFLQLRMLAPDFLMFTAELDKGDRPRVSWPQIASFEMLLPPLDEQRRIVAVLEDHLSRLDAATGGLRAAGARSDALQRRAIVELLKVGGPESELKDVLEVSIGGLWGEPPGESDLDVMVVRVTELGMWGRLDPRTSAIRSVTHKQYESRSLQQGDLLLEKSGGGPATPVGRVGLVTGLEGPAICSNFMQLMRPDRSKILPRWLHLYLNACHLSGRTNKMQKASTNIRNIKASEYLRMTISVPTLDEQESVVAACEGWLLRGNGLKVTVGDIGGRAVALRRALLQSAFSGELTRESISV